MRVGRVGDATFYGSMAQEMQSATRQSPLKLRLGRLAGQISKLGYSASVLVAFADLFHAIVLDNGFQLPLILAELQNLPGLFGHFMHAFTLAITVIALCGGILGVLFMVPLRNALIVREHATLPYPEGTACAEVLLAGEEGGAQAASVFSGLGIAAAFKFIVDGVKLAPTEINLTLENFGAQIGTQIYPALVGVGYIVGPRISSFMFVGGVIGWCVLIPMILLFGL